MYRSDHFTAAILLFVLQSTASTASTAKQNNNNSNDDDNDGAALCRNGCQLLYDEHLLCDSHRAFVPNEYINDDTNSSAAFNISAIATASAFICFDGVDRSEYLENHQVEPGSFDMDSYVFLWQALVIAVVIPLVTLLILRLLQLIWHCLLRAVRCKRDSLCGRCCLHCVSAPYRQQRRNEKFHEEICPRGGVLDDGHHRHRNNREGEANAAWWRWGDKRRESVEQKNNDNALALQKNEYHGVPLHDDNEEAPNAQDNVLESVTMSVGDVAFDQFLEAPGSGVAGQGVELSFSSHGLRQISCREVV